MNGEHLRAFFWLHWRVRFNQLKRGGTANAVFAAIFVGLSILASAVALLGGFLTGLLALREASSGVILAAWDVIVAAFLFFWMIGLMTTLQRSEAISLDKFLHLPVSLSSAFVLNYLTSLVSITLILFAPAMVGLSLGLIFSKGPTMLLVLPLVAALLLAVTAVTYQFQGWLASLMVNKRRRRTVIALVTMGIIVVAQLPNLLNMFFSAHSTAKTDATTQELLRLNQALAAKEIPQEEYTRRKEELERQIEAQEELEKQQLLATARVVNFVVPPGWLPLGASDAVDGKFVTPLLATLGLGLIGAASLRRAYRTTLRLYTGQFTAGTSQDPPAVVQPGGAIDVAIRPGRRSTATAGAQMLEWQLPGIPEPAAAVALASFRSLLRAPEVKLLLISPVVLVVIGLGMSFRHPVAMPEAVRPLTALGAMAMMLFMLVQLVGNQFGFDGNGFRVFILCPAPRHHILLGKNLAVAPLAAAFGLVALIIVQVIYSMRVDYFLAAFPQFVSMYLLFCVAANLLSIVAPMAMASGTFKPVNPKLVPILLNIVFMLVFPAALSPTLLPLGIEVALRYYDILPAVPVCLLLSLAEAVGVVFLYRLIVTSQGSLLQSRERQILNIVARKAE